MEGDLWIVHLIVNLYNFINQYHPNKFNKLKNLKIRVRQKKSTEKLKQT